MFARFLYALLWTILLPLAVCRLAWRSRKQAAYTQHIGERFAHYPKLKFAARPFWLHAVSVGEMRAAQPLIRALRQRWPDTPLLLTCMTPTGRDTAHDLYGADAHIQIAYLPYDHPLLVRRFVRQVKPLLGVILETELWPALLQACAGRHIPVVLANARLSERSARRYARWPRLTQATLGALSAIACQSTADGERLQALGAPHVSITGNLKFDITPNPALCALGQDFRQRIGSRPVWLLASSREGEEALWLDALTQATQLPPQLLWIVVPRHPQRFDEMAALIRARGFALQCRSDEHAVAATTQVWLGNSMGEMTAYFAAAEVCFMGGSWLEYGSQNLIESCAVGTPVILGPSTFNFSEATRLALEAGAARQADNFSEALPLATRWHEHPDEREQAAHAALSFTRAHTGATARTVEVIENVLARAQA